MSTLEMDLDPSKAHRSPNLLDTALQKRYTTISIPSTYGRLHDSPAAGTVVGIVLGSVAGFVLLIVSMSMDEEESVRSRRRPSRRRSDIEVIEEPEFRDSYRRRPVSRHDRIVVEESLATSATQEEDLVEVIEEESSSAPSDMSPRPPRRSRRGGVRHVDPMAYGGDSDYGSRR
ncbi:unnamed protein product [Penicillium bialowiezense]